MARTGTCVFAAGAALFLQFGCDRAPTALDPLDSNADVVVASLSDKEELGKLIFFDENLSLNANLSCASCHGPAWGFTGPKEIINKHGAVYEGSIPGAFGDRKPPSSAYATQSPILHQDAAGAWVGGSFWDGRATGWRLGSPTAEQALGPFLNPKEQALPDAATVVNLVKSSDYAGLFIAVWGPGSLDVPSAFDNIGRSIAAYEASAESNAFSSRFDRWGRGKARLSGEEARGFGLFQGKAKCVNCHPLKGKNPLFTDFTYANTGVPTNPANPAYVADQNFRDPGLGGFLKSINKPEAVYSLEWGKFKVPTLRNVDRRPDPGLVKAYGHNGYFKSLDEIVHFYNTRDVLPRCESHPELEEGVTCWPAPEVAANKNTAVGNLRLSGAEEDAIVAFLKTLSDGYIQ